MMRCSIAEVVQMERGFKRKRRQRVWFAVKPFLFKRACVPVVHLITSFPSFALFYTRLSICSTSTGFRDFRARFYF